MAIKGQECDRNIISGKAKAQLKMRSKPRCIELNRIAFRFISTLCFRTSLSQCQDLETEIAGLVEVETGTETEMAAADSEAAAGSGADLEVSEIF